MVDCGVEGLTRDVEFKLCVNTLIWLFHLFLKDRDIVKTGIVCVYVVVCVWDY